MTYPNYRKSLASNEFIKVNSITCALKVINRNNFSTITSFENLQLTNEVENEKYFQDSSEIEFDTEYNKALIRIYKEHNTKV